MELISYKNFKYVISHYEKRPWGDEMQVAVFNATIEDKSEFGHPHILTIDMRHDAKAESEDIQQYLDGLEIELAAQKSEPEKVYTESEVVALLKEKEILKDGDRLADLKMLSELTVSITAEAVK